MAVILKRHYDLLDLKVTLDVAGSEPTAVCELEATADQKTRRLNRWTFPLRAFGIPETIKPGRGYAGSYRFRLPEAFGAQLGAQLREERVDDEKPLWLHLDAPYGYLGLPPWERELAQ